METIQALAGHDAVGIGIFFVIMAMAIAMNLPREWQTWVGVALIAIAAPVLLVALAILASPWFLMPVLFVGGILCARRA